MGITKMIRAIGRRKNSPQTAARADMDVGRITLDYPQPGEKIATPHYTFRVGTVGATERVEISIDQGPWQPCRYSVGYWWHDWSDYEVGRYQAEVRARLKNGKFIAAAPVKFQVLFGMDGKE